MDGGGVVKEEMVTVGRLGVCVPAMSDPEMLRGCVSYLRGQEGFSARDVLLVSNGARVKDAVRTLEMEEGFHARFPRTNLGTCKTWNMAARWAWGCGMDAVLVLNDDVYLWGLDVLERVRAEVRRDPRRLIVLWRIGFSGFVMTRPMWERVGEFDEGFWPAYFEDNDYHLRCMREGIVGHDVPCEVSHEGSQSLRRWEEWEHWNASFAFPTNARRYLEKWGGPPGRETRKEPWGGIEPWTTEGWLRAMGAPPPPWGW